MNPVLATIANSLLYLLLFLFFKKRNKSSISLFIVLVWLVASVFSFLLLMVFPVSSRVYDSLSIAALLFLFLCFFINVLPVAQIRTPARLLGDRHVLYLFAWFICVLTFLPLLGNVLYFINHLGHADSFGENYGEEIEVLPGIIGSMDRYSKYLRILTPVLLFYFLQRVSKYKLLCACLFLCCLNPIISNLNIGSRFVFVVDSLYYVLVFLLFKSILSKRSVKLISGFAVLLFSVFLFVFISISLTKIESSDVSLLSSLSLYGGESFLNFSGNMWNQCERTNGDNSFYIFKNLLGTYPIQLRDSDALTSKSGVPAIVFYTYVGDFYMDFGPYGAASIVLFISLVLYFIVSRANKSPLIYYYFMMAILIKILLSGFTYYPYLNLAKEIIYAPFVSVILFCVDRILINKNKSKVRPGVNRQ